MAEIPISGGLSGKLVGSIEFEDSPSDLAIQSTAAGFNLEFPAKVTLRWNDQQELRPMLTNLRAIVTQATASGSRAEIGRLRDDVVYTAARPEIKLPAHFVWSDTLLALASVERRVRARNQSFILTFTVNSVSLKGFLKDTQCFARNPITSLVRFNFDIEQTFGSLCCKNFSKKYLEILSYR